jgi:hypothetical protein
MEDHNKRKRDDRAPLWSFENQPPANGDGHQTEPRDDSSVPSKCAKLAKYCLNPISVLVQHYVRQSKAKLGKEDYKLVCKTVTEYFVHNELSDRCLNELANNKKPNYEDVKMTIGPARLKKMKSILAQHGIPMRGQTAADGPPAHPKRQPKRQPAGPSRAAMDSAALIADLEKELSSAPEAAPILSPGGFGRSLPAGSRRQIRTSPAAAI